MKIGELSKRTDCSVQTIRYYEKKRLLNVPHRSESNFRLYDQAALEQLMFIKSCRRLNLSLMEIKQLVDMRESPNSQCEAVNILLDTHIFQVEKHIKELQNLQGSLIALRGKCSNHQTVKDCGILLGLSN